MTEALAPAAKSSNVASSTPDTMEWDSRARRMVMIYLPLSCFVLILLFPFYWMAITSFKPNAELLNYKEHNPFWISSPTLAHIKHLLFDTPLALILTYPTFLVPFCTWLLIGYFKSIPYELEECALIDGGTK